ncbi:MAG: copper oxidase, partial [Blastocatellia bacterium]
HQILTAQPHPTFGSGPNGSWLGAQTTTQRWWADPLINQSGQDRTIRTAFTHDHMSPSSHQMHGLYAGLVVEPTDSQWFAQDGTPLGNRNDGGPTSFAAVIQTANPSNSYREFCLEIADFAIVYDSNLNPINPPTFGVVALPTAVAHNGGVPGIPQPEFFSSGQNGDPGTDLIDYRNEPVGLRLGHQTSSGFVQNSGVNGDPAYSFSSTVHGDPFTRFFNAYEGDHVQIRLLQGAQTELHILNVAGVKWRAENSALNSGFVDFQHIGISEHFEPEFTIPPTPGGFSDQQVAVPNVGAASFVDHLYGFTAEDALWSGMWGILRAYKQRVAGLIPLPSNPNPGPNEVATFPGNSVCPSGAPQRNYTVVATLASSALPGGTLFYNKRFDDKDKNAILFINSTDVNAYKSGAKAPEPLILRANAG